jgi:putative tryptophan/tyrosine transport system substrate-binding protein
MARVASLVNASRWRLRLAVAAAAAREDFMRRSVKWNAVILLAGLGALMGTPGASAADMKTVAITMIVEVPQLVETKDGVLKGLADKGFVVGKNIKLDYQNANGNMPTQQQIAKKFVGEGVDVIVPITTPTSQAVVAATKTIPIVFATVTDPIKAKLISRYKHPGGNVTGVSDAPPIEAQLELFKEIVPKLKKLGFVYNPGLDSSKAILAWVKEQGKKLGLDVVEAAAPTTNEVIPATNKLVGKVDAIYVPNDTTVVAALETVVKIGKDTKTPVFTGETRGVGRGAIASVGLNYTQVGTLAGHMVAEVLNGKKAGDIDAVIAYEMIPDNVVVVNKASAAAMGITIPANVLKRASKVIQ